MPRKDVDRRVAILRKEQIRNTALRFRFQIIIQKYNTYQSHWVRICRQIEEGTYKRDIRRANERFGDGARRGRGNAKEIDLDVDVDLDELNADQMRDIDTDQSIEAFAEVSEEIDLQTLPPPVARAGSLEQKIRRRRCCATSMGRAA